jgi:hypothetical protein
MKKLLSILIIVGLMCALVVPVALAQEDEPPTPELVEEPPADEPPADEPPAAEEPPAEPEATEEPTAEAPTADPEVTDEPPADEPPADEPPADEPVTEEPTVEEPVIAEEPTFEPTVEPTPVPTAVPTEEPTPEPTEEPVVEPTEEPVVDEPAIAGAGAEAGPWTSSIYLSNPHASSSDVTIEFYDTDGTATTYSLPSALAAHGSTIVDVADVGPSGSGGTWQGAAVVKSQNELAAQVSLAVNSSVDRELYSGFKDGSTEVYMPAVVCDKWDQTNTLAVQNVEGTDSTFDVSFKGASGYADKNATGVSFKAYSTTFVNPCDYVKTGWYGSATFSSGNKLAVVNHQPYVEAVKAVAYEGTLSGYNKIYFPTSLLNAYDPEFTTYYALQNVGGSATSVKLTLYNTSGGVVGTKSVSSLGSLEKVSWNPSDAGASDGYSGSAIAEAGTGGLIAGITNIGVKNVTSGCPTGSGQTNAFTQPGEGSANVAIPWVEFKSSSWYTYLAVQNIGSSASGTVTARYYKPDGTLAKSKSLGSIAVGSKANTDANSAGAGSNFLGSVELTSGSATDQLIVLTNNKSANACNGSSTLGVSFTP